MTKTLAALHLCVAMLIRWIGGCRPFYYEIRGGSLFPPNLEGVISRSPICTGWCFHRRQVIDVLPNPFDSCFYKPPTPKFGWSSGYMPIHGSGEIYDPPTCMNSLSYNVNQVRKPWQLE